MASIPLHSAPLHLEIVSDVVCPWCHIGKRRLEAALKLFAQAQPDQPEPQLSWLPFQLNPDMPAGGMSRADYLQRKFGSPDGGGIYERVSTEGHKEGLAFDFKSIARQPNTLKAHALIAAAAGTPVQAVLKEALMIAYFMRGQDLTSDAVLAQIASSAGLASDTARAVLQDSAAHQAAAEQDAELRGLGISGVPFFIINRKFGVSGAQPAEALLAAMEQALSEPSA
jgi:predicted DsbA family dithiol-disulfide isomerase